MPRREEIPEEIRINSEEIEPFAAYLIGRWFAQCEDVRDKDPDAFFDRCAHFWHGMQALNSLSVVCNAPHFSIALSNNLQMVATYIETYTGIDPILDKHPSFPF